MKFRDLTKDEIECRVQSCKENGLVLLLYKDARVDTRQWACSIGRDAIQEKTQTA